MTLRQAQGKRANALRGEALLKIGGAAHVLRPSFTALVAAEEELGPLFALVERAGAGQLRLPNWPRCSGIASTRCTPSRAKRWKRRWLPRALPPAPHRCGCCSARSSRAADERNPARPAALRLCGLAARQLGWRPRDFWAATPAELAAALGLLPLGQLAPPMHRASTGPCSTS